MPAVGLTDHGSLAGAVQLFKHAGEAGRQADHRLRGLRLRRRLEAGEGLRAPDAPRRVERGLRQPHQARLSGLFAGVLLQAARRLGAARDPLGRADRALGLPFGPRLEGARGIARSRRRCRPRPARPGLRARLDLRRDPERGARPAGAHQPAARAHGRGHRPAARRDRRRPLPPARGRARARGAPLHPVRRLAQEPEPLALRHRPVLLQDPGGDGPATSPSTRPPWRGRSRSPSGATSRSSSGRSGCRSTRCPRIATPSTTSSSCARRAWPSGTSGSRPISRSASSTS